MCPFHTLMGIYCPGCGATRMFDCLFSLKIIKAFRWNPLVFTYLILYIGYILINLFRKFLLKKDNILLSNKLLISLIVIVIVFGVARNFSYFSYLAPTGV